MREKGEVAEYKKEIVAKLEELFKKYPYFGVVNMRNLPAKQQQRIRRAIREKVTLWMTKKRLIKIAINNLKDEIEGIDGLIPYLEGMPALIFSEQDPFVIAKLIQKNKSKAAIKPGQVAPNDIKVTAGPTDFAPGPIIGQLGALGIKSKIQDGKVEIVSDAVIAKEGEEVGPDAASILARMGVEPVEVGLNLVAVYADGEILEKQLLFIDEQEYLDKITAANAAALALALEVKYYTKQTVQIILQQAFRESKSLALESGVVSKDTMPELLNKAENEASVLKSKIEEV